MFLCPICNHPLTEEEKAYTCTSGHRFDKAKSGYVNLLPPRAKAQHGDNQRMLSARRRFLDGGYYQTLRDALCHLIDTYTDKNPILLDAGCGECYYTEGVADVISQKAPKIYGIDISKDALILGGKRKTGAKLAAASIYKMPLPDGHFDLIYNVFSPLCIPEFERVLKPGGILLLVIPLENHLWELKTLLYNTPYKNNPRDPSLPPFSFLGRTDVIGRIDLCSPAAIQNLFEMTPYCYRTPPTAAEKIAAAHRLTVTTEFSILAYQKNK